MSIEKLLWEEDATGLAGHVKAGEVSPPELVEAAIARAEKVNPELNAVVERLYDDARKAAGRCDMQAPLAGVPFAIKDLGIAVKGVPSHSGSRVPPRIPDFDSVLTERYRAAGLIPIVTSTSPEIGLRLMTESKAFGITRNPWNTGHTSGGSSGGAAALVAAGVVPVAHASDGGGSIRVPSATTGLVGLKVSRGRIPVTPLMSEAWFGWAVDHVVSRSVRDSALLLDLTHGPDPLAPYAARAPQGSFAEAAARAPGKLKLAVWHGTPLGLEVSTETRAALDKAVALAREGGHTVEEIDLPEANRAFLRGFAHVVSCCTASLARQEADRLGHPVLPMLERATRIMVRLGESLSGAQLEQNLQQLGAASREIILRSLPYDAVLMPLIAHPPLPTGAMDPKGADAMLEAVIDTLRLSPLLKIEAFIGELMNKSLWFTHWSPVQNVTGQPAIALPVHVTDTGLPLGIQAVGRPGDEATLLSLAAQLEGISGWRTHRADLLAPA